MALTEAAKVIPSGQRLSPVKVIRVIQRLVVAVASHSTIKTNLKMQLAACVIADESKRKSCKNSKDYPRKKKKREAGEPAVKPISKELMRLAKQRLN
jgi:2-polyprenyl-3-methyl-5-hydroxy-6-metoxy-1,4-benzoquinol methylase